MPATHEFDQIEIVNPTDIDFTEPRGKADLEAGKAEAIEYGGHPYKIKAGEKKTYQRFLANHIAKHMTDVMIRTANKQGRKVTYNDEDFRRECWNKIQVGVVSYFQPGEATSEGAKVAAQQEEINRMNEDRMMKLERELESLRPAKKTVEKAKTK